MFIQQTLYCSGILKLSWAALKYVWEILLPAATWQRNPRMESAAAPFQIGHLWWHGRCTIIVQWQPDLTTRRCQRFLRISNLGRRQHPTQQSLSLQSGKRPNLVGYISDIPKSRPYRIQPLVSKGQREPRNEPMECHSVMGVGISGSGWTHQEISPLKIHWRQKNDGCIFQACRLGESKTWKSNYVYKINKNLYQLWRIFCQKTLRK